MSNDRQSNPGTTTQTFKLSRVRRAERLTRLAQTYENLTYLGSGLPFSRQGNAGKFTSDICAPITADKVRTTLLFLALFLFASQGLTTPLLIVFNQFLMRFYGNWLLDDSHLRLWNDDDRNPASTTPQVNLRGNWIDSLRLRFILSSITQFGFVFLNLSLISLGFLTGADSALIDLSFLWVSSVLALLSGAMVRLELLGEKLSLIEGCRDRVNRTIDRLRACDVYDEVYAELPDNDEKVSNEFKLIRDKVIEPVPKKYKTYVYTKEFFIRAERNLCRDLADLPLRPSASHGSTLTALKPYLLTSYVRYALLLALMMLHACPDLSWGTEAFNHWMQLPVVDPEDWGSAALEVLERTSENAFEGD